MQLKLKFTINSIEHDGYCSGSEAEYKEFESMSFTIDVPENFLGLNEKYTPGQLIALECFKDYRFVEVIEQLELGEDTIYYPEDIIGFARDKSKYYCSGQCFRETVPRKMKHEQCNARFFTLVKALLIQY